MENNVAQLIIDGVKIYDMVYQNAEERKAIFAIFYTMLNQLKLDSNEHTIYIELKKRERNAKIS